MFCNILVIMMVTVQELEDGSVVFVESNKLTVRYHTICPRTIQGLKQQLKCVHIFCNFNIFLKIKYFSSLPSEERRWPMSPCSRRRCLYGGGLLVMARVRGCCGVPCCPTSGRGPASPWPSASTPPPSPRPPRCWTACPPCPGPSVRRRKYDNLNTIRYGKCSTLRTRPLLPLAHFTLPESFNT